VRLSATTLTVVLLSTQQYIPSPAMSYCMTVGCSHPENLNSAEYCQGCGQFLLLQNRYLAIKPLSRGGFGRTFLAIDQQIPSHPHCVIKQFFVQYENPQDYQTAAKLFRQEAVRLDQLGKHPQIPQLLAHFEQNKQLFIIQEYIQGKTLFDELKQDGLFTEQKIWQVLKQILPILQFIHEQNIIHRDIKPANLMRRCSLPSSGENSLDTVVDLTQIPPTIPMRDQEQAQISAKLKSTIYPILSPENSDLQTSTDFNKNDIVLIDFGISKLLTGTALLHSGTIVGTPEFMAPEQMRGTVYPASDLYSLGLTCLYLITGISPGKLYDDHDEKWNWRSYLIPQQIISDRLETVLNKLIVIAINQRYKSAEEVLTAIQSSETPVNIAVKPVIPIKKTSAKVVQTPAKTPNLLERIKQNLGYQPLNDPLKSAVGVDYTQLQTLLAQKRWKQADQETWFVLCQALKKSKKTYLYAQDLANLPCEDLQTINHLWVKYSNSRFGFSIQNQIYQTVEGDYGKFCQQVGWLTYNPNNPDYGIEYKTSAPTGHLPTRNWIVSTGKWWKNLEILAEKLASCKIN
jgi:serine/threonine protein kinase